MNRRSEILNATSEAARISSRFPVVDRLSFDILGALAELDIPIRFRRLAKLWGACITVDGAIQGILVTTALDLPTQRFTLAHELGHALLGHRTSFDESVGFQGRHGGSGRPVHEVAADTFASELLASRSLMLGAAKRHQWTTQALHSPSNIYQLALRLGISYQAACWGLVPQGVLTKPMAERLQAERVKDLKIQMAPEGLITNPWANVWKLTEADTGSYLEGGPDDLFAVRLSDHASAGYLWQLVDSGPNGEVIDEQTRIPDSYGEPTSRTVFLRFHKPGVHRLVFEHRRPWNRDRIGHIDIRIENYGKETGGLPRSVREAALARVDL